MKSWSARTFLGRVGTSDDQSWLQGSDWGGGAAAEAEPAEGSSGLRFSGFGLVCLVLFFSGLEAQVCVIPSHLIILCLLGLSLSRSMIVFVVPPRLEGSYEIEVEACCMSCEVLAVYILSALELPN